MNKRNESFIKQLLNVSIGTLITLVIGFFTTPVITRLVTTETYGVYSLFSMTSSIFLMFACLGLDQGYIRYYYLMETETKRNSLLKFCVLIPLLFVLLFGWVGVVVLRYQTGQHNNTISVLFFINVIALVLYRFSTLVLRMQSKTKLFSLINVIHKLTYVCFAIVFIHIFSNDNAISLPIAYTLAYVITSTVGVVISKNKFFKKNSRLYKSEIPFKEILRYSIPLLVSGGVFTIFQSLDKYCLNSFMGHSDVGVYSSAQSLMTVFSVIQSSFNTVWAPQAIRHFESNHSDTTYFKKMHEYIVVVMFSFGVLLILFKDIYVLLLGKSYRDAVSVLPFLVLNPVMYTISETTVNGLHFKKKSNWIVITVVLSALVNLVGNILLIPVLGIRGAAVSTGISYILFFILRTTLSKKVFFVDFNEFRLYFLLLLFLPLALYSSYHKTDFIIILGAAVLLFGVLILYKTAALDMVANFKNIINRKKSN